MIGAGLLIRSFGKLQAFDPGFNAEGVLTLMLDLPQGSYADDAQVAQFYQRLEERLAALPDVQSVSMTSTLPLEESVDYYSSFTLPDREPPPPGEQIRVDSLWVASGIRRGEGWLPPCARSR